MKKLFIYTLLLLNISISLAQYHDTTGEVTVDGSGSVNYKIPIVVPPGIKNVSPQVTLSYSSSSANGIAGYGWNLIGISSINRIGTRIDIDGYIDPVNFNNNDQFALDGQRLIKQTDNTFRTENYSNLNVTINNNDPLAPDYFIVHAADGAKSFYGNVSNSKGVAEWLITKWVDVYGNTINYEYYKENNVINVAKITWSENEKKATNYKNTIVFNYRNRLRPESAFLHGTKLVNNKLLDNIIVSTNEQQFKKYIITYSKNELNYEMVSSVREYNSTNEASNPINFKYSTTDSRIDKYEARLSDNSINSNSNIRATGDFDGDGKLDAIIGGKMYFNLYGDFIGNTSVKDFIINGYNDKSNLKLISASAILENGKLNQKNYLLKDSQKNVSESDNISVQNNHEVYIDLHKFENDRFVPFFKRTIPFPHLGGYMFMDGTPCGNSQPRYDSSPYLKYIEGDFNGDGISELLVLGSITRKRVVPIDDNNGGIGTGKPLQQICDVVMSSQATPSYLVDLNPNISDTNATKRINFSTSIPSVYTEIIVFDFNGDGKQDIFYITDTGKYYIETLNNNGNGFEMLATGDLTEYNKSRKNTNLIFGDYNGDSKADILIPTEKNSTNWSLYLSTGTGFEKSNVTIEKYEESGSGNTYSFNDVYYPLDINGDGKSDLVRVRLESHKNDWTINNTDSFYEIKAFSNITSSEGNPTFTNTNTYHSGNRARPFPGMPLVGNFKSHSANYQLMIMRDDTDANTVLDVFNFTKNQTIDSRVVEITEGNDVIKHKFEYQRLDKNNTVYKFVANENYPLQELDVLPETYVVSKQIYEADGNSKYKLFQYRGLTAHFHGLGTLGFKKVAQSSWINDAINVSSPIWQVNEMSPQLKGANIKSWSFIGNNLALIDTPIDDQLLNKTEVSYLYNILADKRTVLIPTQTIDKNILTGVESKTSVEYDSFYNVSKQIASTTATGSSFINTNESEYYNDTSSNIIGRLTFKKESITAYNDHFSTQVNYIYNGNNLVLAETNYQDSGKSKMEYEYDEFGNIIKETDYGNYMTENTTPRIIKNKYDSSGRFVIEKINIDNFSEFLEYNNLGQVTKQTDILGVIVNSYYDSWGKLLRTELHNASTTPTVTTYSYNRNASGTNIVTSNLQTLEYSIQYFDIQGRNIKNTIKGFSDNQYVSTSIEYNFLGSKIRESQPYFGNSPSLWTTYEYDNLLRPIKITNPTGLIATNTYNGLEATSVEGVRSKKVIKDALDNTIQIIDNGTELIEHTYFAHGGLKSTKYENHIIETKYDVFGRKIYFLDPTVSAIPYTYAYNNFNDIIEENAPETTTQFTYDSSGRILKKRTTGKSNLEVNYTYDPALKNLLTKEEGANEGKLYTNILNYDTFYRVVGKTNVTPYFSFNEAVTYDAIGRIENTTSKILKDGQVLQNVTLNHQYNLYNGDLQLVKDVSNGIVGKTIWEVSQKSERGEALNQKLGEIITLENTFDSYGNLININHRNGTQWLANKEYYYQVDRGLLIKRKDTHFNWEENFTYDTFDRLLTWSSPLGTNSNTYIADGRINENSQVGQYSYNTTAKYKKESIELNNNGLNHYNTRTNQTIVYDGFKRPLNITEENRGSVDFEYGINSSRIKAVKNNLITNTTATKYYAPSGSIEITVDAQQNAKIVNYLGSPYETPYIYVTEINLDSKVKTNESFYYLGRDFQGSITEIFESNGTSTIERRLFDPWGNITKLEDNIGGNYIEGENAFLAFLDRGYTGHEHFTEVGIIHMNGRIYDPILKQFLSPDNFIQDPSNSQNYNRYGYAWNNPLKYTDPSGELFAEIGLTATIAIAAAAGAFSYTMVALTTWTEFSALGLIKSATVGAISGAVSFGIGELMASVTSVVTAQIQSAILHGFSQGMISGITGGDFETSFVSAIVSSVVSGGVQFGAAAAGIKNSGATTILFGTASGALTARLTKGNVWQAATTAFFVSALNHAAHKIKVRDMVMENLDAMGKNPRDIPEYSEDSVHDLIKRDSTLSKMNQNAKNPKVEVGGVYGKSPDAAAATYGYSKSKTVGYIGYNKSAFNSYYTLYHAIGHELNHAIQFVSGYAHNAIITYGEKKALALMDADSYGWNYRMSPTNKTYSDYQRMYLKIFYAK